MTIAAAALLAACGEKPEPTPAPAPKEKAFSVSPSTLSVNATDTKATIDVKAEVAWTAKSDNSAFSVSPASGNGDGTITVSFPANTETSEVKAVVTVSTSDEAAKTKSYTVNITQAAAEPAPGPGPDPGPGPEPTERDTTYLARWWLDESQVEVLGAHFAEEAKIDGNPNPDAGLPGNGGYYVEPNVAGKGRIEFYNGIDKNSINPKGRVKRVIGKYGGIVSYGTWKGDYYLLTAETDSALPAGTDIYTFFAIRANVDNVPKYWMVEILDGDTWKPYLATKKVTVDGEGEVEYNIELVYENGAEKPCIDFIVDDEYKLTASTKNVVIRILAVSSAYAYGEGLPEVIGDSAVKAKNPVTILVGNRLSETGNPVLHHTMICTLNKK